MRKQLSRFLKKQKDSGLSIPKVTTSPTIFFKSVRKIQKETGSEAAMTFVAKSIQTRIVLMGKGTKVLNANNSLAFTRRHQNQTSITIEAPRVHVSIDDVEWHVWLASKSVPLCH
jgi:hypothetical protein